MRTKHVATQLLVIVFLSLLLGACGGKPDRPPAVTGGPPTPPATTTVPQQMTAPPPPMDEGGGDELISLESDPFNIREMDLTAVNEPGNNPFEDVRFDFDSAALSAEARATLERHSETLKTYREMTILVEGHCDERGTVEYNLALGERRANAILNYLVSLGIGAGRLKTISYGKEFPLDPGHNEAAWARNRRGHFEITAK